MNDNRHVRGWKKITLKDLEKEHGNLEEIIPKLVNQGGQTYAAFQLSTSTTTISKWLKAHGYVQQVTYVKARKLEAAS